MNVGTRHNHIQVDLAMLVMYQAYVVSYGSLMFLLRTYVEDTEKFQRKFQSF